MGFPGRLKSSVTPFQYAHQSNDREMNSGPLSIRIACRQVPHCWLAHLDGKTLTTKVLHERQDLDSMAPEQLVGRAVHAAGLIDLPCCTPLAVDRTALVTSRSPATHLQPLLAEKPATGYLRRFCLATTSAPHGFGGSTGVRCLPGGATDQLQPVCKIRQTPDHLRIQRGCSTPTLSKSRARRNNHMTDRFRCSQRQFRGCTEDQHQRAFVSPCRSVSRRG